MPNDHPDSAWIADQIRDLQAWLDEPCGDATSQVTGGGAVRAAEERFAAFHDDRPCVLLPSATYGMRAALLAAGVASGDRVLIPGVDWGATLAAVRSVGAIPVPANTDPETFTLDPGQVPIPLDPAIRAAVACHLHGVPADVVGLRRVLGESVPIIEDCAQALGSTLDGRLVGTLGHLAVFSFGPSKPIDVGEAAMVVCGSHSLHERLMELTAHPVRQLLAGLTAPALAEFAMRVHPTSAVRLASRLRSWSPSDMRSRHAELRARIHSVTSLMPLGGDARRENAAPSVPVRSPLQPGEFSPHAIAPSAAVDIARLIAGEALRAEVSLVGCPCGASTGRVRTTTEGDD